MISEKGSLQDTNPMKILLTLSEKQLTGILYLKNEDVLKVLYFNKGKLIWAISNSEEDKLENILLSQELVDPDILMNVKKEAHVSDTVGKLLVEKGLITLEELIDCSKKQLKHIFMNVLKWKNGGFQFVKDAPPERLLSLDLDITEFITDFIREELSISDIWKEIGALQIEFIKNPDEQKVARYHLSDKQKEFLNSFTGENNLETILSRHADGHRESLLKIIYFFLMSDLLLKKEFELSDSSEFDDNIDIDLLKNDSFKNGADSYESLVREAEKAREPAFENSEKFHEQDEYVAPAEQIPGITEYVKDEIVIPPFLKGKEKNGERKKIKMVSLILISFIFVLGGIILLLLLNMLKDEPVEKLIKTTDNGSIITKWESKPVVKNERKEEGIPAETEGEKTDIQGDKSPENVEEKKIVNKKVEQNKKEDKLKLSQGKNAMTYFIEGNLIIAGDMWKRELKKKGIKFSILLEMDCVKKSVKDAYERIGKKDDFFILNKKVGRRGCFLVMWGKYNTQKEAAKVINKVPQYFWKQQHPPEVIELSQYL